MVMNSSLPRTVNPNTLFHLCDVSFMEFYYSNRKAAHTWGKPKATTTKNLTEIEIITNSKTLLIYLMAV